MGNDEFIDIYRRYLAKFEKLFGELDFDETVQHRGKLVKKMRYDEFITKWTEFKQIEDYLREVMSKGATLNDEVNRNYLELSASVLENPKDFVLI